MDTRIFPFVETKFIVVTLNVIIASGNGDFNMPGNELHFHPILLGIN